MAIRPIVEVPDPRLREISKPVESVDDELRSLVADMFETMEEAPGVGLAAPQVGVPLRVFVFNWLDDDERLWRGVAINPELMITPAPVGPADEDTESEGCLSIPSERYPLRRGEKAVLTAFDLNEKAFEVHATGWLARIFQHEYDHLNGILYADRLEHAHALAVAKTIKKAKWGVPGMSWTPGIDDIDA